jgi:hypothetical protein
LGILQSEGLTSEVERNYYSDGLENLNYSRKIVFGPAWHIAFTFTDVFEISVGFRIFKALVVDFF